MDKHSGGNANFTFAINLFLLSLIIHQLYKNYPLRVQFKLTTTHLYIFVPDNGVRHEAFAGKGNACIIMIWQIRSEGLYFSYKRDNFC